MPQQLNIATVTLIAQAMIRGFKRVGSRSSGHMDSCLGHRAVRIGRSVVI